MSNHTVEEKLHSPRYDRGVKERDSNSIEQHLTRLNSTQLATRQCWWCFFFFFFWVLFASGKEQEAGQAIYLPFMLGAFPPLEFLALALDAACLV